MPTSHMSRPRPVNKCQVGNPRVGLRKMRTGRAGHSVAALDSTAMPCCRRADLPLAKLLGFEPN